jgi:serine/threonine protein kinase
VSTQGPGMAYPLRSEYVDALQYPATAFADTSLKRGRVACNKFGLPEAISGAFAPVFQVILNDGTRWAVKCFCQSVPDQERRYHEISAALRRISLPALVEFEYLQAGILISGRPYPVLKMEWIDAQGLLQWLEANRFDSRRVHSVAEQLVAVVAALEAADIAHGDLQHGNLLVSGNDRLRLIDYDGMYVPALAGLSANEKGLANYQSPARTDQHFRPGLDRFAGWVIYASLVALAVAPQLWQLRAEGDEKLLFGATDYTNPSASTAFATLRQNARLARLADLIADLSQTSVENIPALDPTAHLGSFASTAPPSLASRRSTSLPIWMEPVTGVGRPPTSAPLQASSPVQPADGSWLAHHLPPLPPKTFAGSARFAAVRVLVYIVAALGLASAIAMLVVLPPLGAAVLVLAALLNLLVLTVGYHRQPLYREARNAHSGLAAARDAHKKADAAYQKLVKQEADLQESFRVQRSNINQARDRLPVERQHALTAVQRMLNTSLARVAAELGVVNASESTRRTARLQQVQEAYVRQRLAAARVRTSPPSGIGDQLANRLERSGIRSAADFVASNVSGFGRDERTSIVLANQQRVHVDGIGPKKAESLVRWRNGIYQSALQSAPQRLSVADEQQLQAELARDRRGLDQQAALARSQAQRDQTAAVERERALRADFDRQEKDASDLYTTRQASVTTQVAASVRYLNNQRALLDQAAQRDQAYAAIRFGPYVKRIATGRV